MFINFAIIVDPLLWWLCYQSTSSCEEQVKISLRVTFFAWWLVSKNIKLIGLYMRNIWEIRFLLVSIPFGYFHSFIKLWALCTLHKV
jgi:hypothetical protein